MFHPGSPQWETDKQVRLKRGKKKSLVETQKYSVETYHILPAHSFPGFGDGEDGIQVNPVMELVNERTMSIL